MLKSESFKGSRTVNAAFSTKDLQRRTCSNVFHLLLALSKDYGHGGLGLTMSQSVRDNGCPQHAYILAQITSLSQDLSVGFSSARIPLFQCCLVDAQGNSKTLVASLDDIKFLLQSHLCSCSRPAVTCSVEDILMCDNAGNPLSCDEIGSPVTFFKAIDVSSPSCPLAPAPFSYSHPFILSLSVNVVHDAHARFFSFSSLPHH